MKHFIYHFTLLLFPSPTFQCLVNIWTQTGARNFIRKVAYFSIFGEMVDILSGRWKNNYWLSAVNLHAINCIPV